MIQVDTVYRREGHTLSTERAKVPVGGGEGEFLPYELLLGALSSCFYYTLRGILEKRRIECREIRIRVEGSKRENVPTTLKSALMDITFVGDIDEKAAARAVKLAGEYCSIHHTLSLVAEIEHRITIAEE